MMRLTSAVLFALTMLAGPVQAAEASQVRTSHAIAMHGEPKYGPGFQHFDYVNPDAPKGGDVRLHAIGSFDSLNPFIVKGQPPVGAGLPFETLLAGSADEAFTEYGLLAETITMPDDRSWVEFTLRPAARWHDGKPITPEDVIFSLDVLKRKGAPFYRLYYASVDKAEQTGPRSVKFTFREGENRELPLIIGQMPVLPRHYWEGRSFDETTLEAPLGSGAYRVASFEPGRYVVYERVADYWGKDLPVTRGMNNFDTIRYDYYRDTTVALEAFKAGQYDWRPENESKKWATSYDFPAVQTGQVKKEEVDNDRPTGMQAYVYNLRRPLFQDPKVRQALAYAFDFEWTNQNLFYGQYARTESYFSNSELAAQGLPSADEVKILTPLADQIPAEVFTADYRPPSSDGSGNIRPNLRQAMALLKQAGWEIKQGRLINSTTGQPFAFEILLNSPAFERITLPFTQNLERLGITATVRTVDTAQYKNREDSRDFDMIVNSWGQSLSPGNEQREFWGSESADQPGSRNLIGIKNPAIDTLIDLVIAAPDRESLITRTRALDRVLQWNHYVIPHWHIGYDRIAYWDKFGRPAEVPAMGVQFFAWWIDRSKPLAANSIKQGAMPSLSLIAAAQAQAYDTGRPPLLDTQPSTVEPRPDPTPRQPGTVDQQLSQETAPTRDAVPMPAAEAQGSWWWVVLGLAALVVLWFAMRRRQRRR